jgi:hypothetical protein
VTTDHASAPRTRRTILAAALGAGAATIVSVVGRPLPARATGTPVTVGDTVTGSSVTTIDIRAALLLP